MFVALYTFMDSGIQTTGKANELCSVMIVRKNGFHSVIMAYMLQVAEIATQRCS